LTPPFTLVSFSDASSILKMEAIFSSEKSVDFQRTTRRYIPEDSTLHKNHRCENLKSYIHHYSLPQGWGTGSIIRQVSDLMIEFILHLYNWLQQFTNRYLTNIVFLDIIHRPVFI
jgi:hypothetical protein